jgi:hypothetical protein
LEGFVGIINEILNKIFFRILEIKLISQKYDRSTSDKIVYCTKRKKIPARYINIPIVIQKWNVEYMKEICGLFNWS